MKPYAIGSPVRLEVEFHEGAYLDALRSLYAEEMSSGRTLSLIGDSVTAVWADYWQRKLRCQAAMSNGNVLVRPARKWRCGAVVSRPLEPPESTACKHRSATRSVGFRPSIT